MRKSPRIDWSTVVAIDAFTFHNTQSPRRFFHLRQLAKLYLTHTEIKPETSAEYLCFRSLDRADYKELFESIVGTIESSKILIQDFQKRRKIPNLKALLNLLWNLPQLARLGSWPIKTRLYLYCRIAFYMSVARQIAKHEFGKLVVFADMQPLDNLLVQYFADKPSVTLQHGLYVDYKDFDTVNVVNYKCQVADHFLAWGQDTAALISRYHPETHVVICGKPNLGQEQERANDTKDDYFAVVFDQNMYEEYNFRLLKIAYRFAEQTGLKFYLKFHPWNNPKKYAVDSSFTVERRSLGGSKFVIGHTTSLLYELLRVGVPAFKLRSPEYALPTPDELQFKDASELQALSGRNVSPSECVEIGKGYISDYGDASLKKYRYFFQN